MSRFEDGIQVCILQFCILVNSIVDRSSANEAEDTRRYFSIVLIVFLTGQKVLKTVLVEFACVIRRPCVG